MIAVADEVSQRAAAFRPYRPTRDGRVSQDRTVKHRKADVGGIGVPLGQSPALPFHGHRRFALTDGSPFSAQSQRCVTESAVMAKEIEVLTDRASGLKPASEPVRIKVKFPVYDVAMLQKAFVSGLNTDTSELGMVAFDCVAFHRFVRITMHGLPALSSRRLPQVRNGEVHRIGRALIERLVRTAGVVKKAEVPGQGVVGLLGTLISM